MVPSPVINLFNHVLQRGFYRDNHDYQLLAFIFIYFPQRTNTLRRPSFLQRYNNRDFQPSVPGVISGREIIHRKPVEQLLLVC